MKTTLLFGDCLDLMKQIPDGSVDMVCTDPPYNISQNQTSLDRSKFKSKKMCRKSNVILDFGAWDKYERQDFLDFTSTWFGECARILKDGGSIVSFFSLQDISLLAWFGFQFGIRYRNFFTWIKTNPIPSIYRRNYLSATEMAYIGSKGDKPWTFNFSVQREMHNIFITPNKSVYGETSHPNEKPIALMEHFIRVHSDKGMTILDPFMGSGTTGVACIHLDRNFIGIEKEQKYFEIAKKRIEEAKAKPIQEELL